ncbi:MAG: aminoacyl-tRNA hydrolase [Flavobacteriaceae bacterium]|nr:aminoacyl-tRNA hydrolase [Flavobacteriaceae bacterium]
MFAIVKKWFQKEPESEEDMHKYLIVGLGNIGDTYAETRHNIGFKILDAFAEKHQVGWESARLASRSVVRIKGRTFVLIKPTTFMNLSGKSVKYWLQQEKIPLEHLLVITDDLNLSFGTIRIRTKGSHGGHNGLKDIETQLNSAAYNRFRFGISDAFSKGQQIDYVLGTWEADEIKNLPERLEKSCEVIVSFGLAGIQHTMNTFNGK